VAELSKKRTGLTASVVGDKVYFIGGGDWENALLASNVIDIYDAITNQWSTIRMPNPRMEHTATVIGSKIYIAGGTLGWWTNLHFLNSIDVYDTESNTWSTLPDLGDRRVDHAAASVGNLIFWAGGIRDLGDFLQDIEIRDLASGEVSFACMSPKIVFSAVQTTEHIIFFPGTELLNPANRLLEIYHIPSGKWYTGLLEKAISQAAVVVLDNQVYVAGGSGPGGEYNKEVWRLKF
jgi:N-acetylneuraminic acid mutarotase